jgi:hypothetical protein
MLYSFDVQKVEREEEPKRLVIYLTKDLTISENLLKEINVEKIIVGVMLFHDDEIINEILKLGKIVKVYIQ